MCLPARSWDGSVAIHLTLIDGESPARTTSPTTWNQNWPFRSTTRQLTVERETLEWLELYNSVAFAILGVHAALQGSEGEGTMNAHMLVIRNFSKEGNWDGKELDRIYGIASSGERQGRRGTKRGKCGATDRTKLEIRRASRFPPAGGRGPKGSQIRLLQNIFYCQLPKKTGTKRQQNKNIAYKSMPGKLKKRGEPWVESSPVRSRRLRQGTSHRAPCQEGWSSSL